MKIAETKAVVTGAAQGLGRHFALSLLQEGAGVAAGDINEAGLRRLKADAAALPGTLIVGGLDVSNEASVMAFVERADRELNGINVLSTTRGSCGTGAWFPSTKERRESCRSNSGARCSTSTSPAPTSWRERWRRGWPSGGRGG